MAGLRTRIVCIAVLVGGTPAPALAGHPELMPAGEAEVSTAPVWEGVERFGRETVETSVHGEVVELPNVGRVRKNCNKLKSPKKRRNCKKQQNGTVPPAPPAQPENPAYSPWCGDDAYSDVNPVGPEVRRVKVIFARPQGTALRFRQYAPMIQSDVQFINHFFLTETGGERIVRFDVGTSCGPRYVDIQIVNLPRTRAEYLAGDDQDRWSMLSEDLLDRLGSSRSNYLVYADDLYREGWASGMASFYDDDSPGLENDSNTIGRGRAVLLGSGGENFLGSEGWDETRRRILLHELLHTLGAVQPSAPRSTDPQPHCWDEEDVMCYEDSPLIRLAFHCTNPTFSVGALDCNRNDYFDLAPVAGSYLASHWNVASSAYLYKPGA